MKSFISDLNSVVPKELSQQSLMALGWVIDSIEENLQHAKSSIASSNLREDFKDIAELLHQVSGTLAMTELIDTLLLSESLEQLALAINTRKIAVEHKKDLSSGIDTLSRALQVLHHSKRVQSLAIYRCIKNIRALLQDEKLKDLRRYPKIDYSLLVAPDQIKQVFDGVTQQKLVDGYRHLLNEFFLDSHNQSILSDMLKMAQHFSSGAATIQEAVLWRILTILHHALSEGKVDPTFPPLKLCLIHLERLLAQGQFDEEIIFELLELFDSFEIEHDLIIQQHTINTAVEEGNLTSPLVLDKILGLVQEVKDQFAPQVIARDIHHNKKLLMEAINLLQLTGWRELAEQLELILSQISVTPAISKSEIYDVLEKNEHQLSQLVMAFQQAPEDAYKNDSQKIVDDAKSAVLRESRVAIEGIKTLFFDYSASKQVHLLITIEQRFQELKGVFILMGLQQPAQILEKICHFIHDNLLDNDYIATRYQIDLIAEIISSIEYYLDQLAHHFYDEQILNGIEQILQKFHQPVHEKNPQVQGEKLFHDNTSLAILTAMEGLAMVDQASPQSNTDHLGHKAMTEIEVVSDDFSQDEEIREIFIEEASEVLETLDTLFPAWVKNQDNIEQLKDIRRAFHTLKGSGRMVGAKISGELAWSIENMLNRLLENSIKITPVMVELITKVLSIYPTLVENFTSQQQTKIEIRPMMYVASLLSKGQSIALNELPWTVSSAHGDTAPLSIAADDVALNIVEQATDDTSFEPATDVALFDSEDREGLAIFVEEAEDHLNTIHAFIAEHATDEVVPDDLIRALHTLRGSAAMSKVDSVYHLSTALEEEFKRLIRLHLPVSDLHINYLEKFVQCVGHHLESLEGVQRLALNDHDVSLIDQVKAFSAEQNAAHGHDMDAETQAASTMGLVTQLLDLAIDDVLDAEYELEQQLKSDDASNYIESLFSQSTLLYQASVGTPIKALHQLGGLLVAVYDKLRHVNVALLDDDSIEKLLNAHYALTGIFDALAASQQPQLDGSVSDGLQQILASDYATASESEVIELIDSTQDQITTQPFEDINLSEPPLESPVWIEPVPQVEPQLVSATIQQTDMDVDHSVDTELLEIFLEEAEELVEEIDQSFALWQKDPANIEPLKVLQRHLHTLKGGARMAQVASLGDFGHELETVYERLVNGSLKSSPNLIRFMRHAQDVVADQVEQLSTQGKSFFAHREMTALLAYLHHGDETTLSNFANVDQAVQPATTIQAPVVAVEQPIVDVEQPEIEVAEAEAVAVELQEAVFSLEEKAPTFADLIHTNEIHISDRLVPAIDAVDASGEAVSYAKAMDWSEQDKPESDLLALFLEEAEEQIARSDTLLATWLKDIKDKKPLLELQRSMHTIRGGARMSKIAGLSSMAHELELVYEDLATSNLAAVTLVGQLLKLSHQWISDSLQVLQQGMLVVEPLALVQALQRFQKDTHSLRSLPRFDVALAEFKQDQSTETLFEQVEVIEVQGDGSEPPPMLGRFNEKSVEQSTSNNEMIRVSANLMEKMINLSGENAINRARIEMGVNNIGFVLSDMGLAIQRLVEQLRRMEGELESQILARHEQERDQYVDFDPLEMDQYSSLNQLSKSLAESASDLVDFKSTLMDKIRDTENLLLQQSRIQSELQDGLMNSRLVPFSRLLPRLQRVVRQTATELAKPAELIVKNAEGELDRTILERIVAPLEHMLRNAVDHGLETPEQRIAANKPAQGQINLNVERQGNEIIIQLTDDGKGINVEAVREKAIQRGLITADSQLTDYEVIQFIFHAGLSTAEKVTQISGRGVGMDVVQSEIKLLGGSVTVESNTGQGSCFTLRLPLTVAVTDALMVRIADRQFAIPLSQIDRIVRVSPIALEQYYHSSKDTFEIDGHDYRLRYLGEFIHGVHAPNLQSHSMSLPVLLIKSMGQTTAIQVDQLIGSRAEIVVKPAGHQLATIDLISGATIAGDGSVMIILDAQALARRAAATARHHMDAVSAQPTVASRVESRKRLVMVVDDSVTVRKVTTRLLERQGFEVVTAKDGVDAIEKLEDVTPDIMLLDIEMPRMDGFEVANLVRHNERIADLPIIMITSRTGEKHRERAFLTGVNCYMGKPFQELELLQNIDELLAVANQ
jgi:chemotaxis protein histidine kinase CheA/CheY-like chemotaxis protein